MLAIPWTLISTLQPEQGRYMLQLDIRNLSEIGRQLIMKAEDVMSVVPQLPLQDRKIICDQVRAAA
jgi:hypothetical protein